jgi:hypothetical protein
MAYMTVSLGLEEVARLDGIADLIFTLLERTTAIAARSSRRHAAVGRAACGRSEA